jgi:eukaryotic-like serine/threonine-protein kinase
MLFTPSEPEPLSVPAPLLNPIKLAAADGRDFGARIGQTIAHYRLLEPRGRGGIRVIYRAQDLRLGRHVAIKFVSAGFRSDAAICESIRREA